MGSLEEDKEIAEKATEGREGDGEEGREDSNLEKDDGLSEWVMIDRRDMGSILEIFWEE